jgi:hypothetical protein
MMQPSATGHPDRRSWVRWLGLAAAVGVAGLAAAYAYHRGRVAAGLDVAEVAIERRELSAKVARLEAENGELGAKVAELEMARRLDREAYGQVERTLGELQSQLSRQGDDLAFYRSIVSPDDGVQGLRIQRLEIQPGDGPREFVLRLTLIQAMRHESVASGLAQVVLHGMQGDRPTRHTLGELLGRPRAQLPFSFRYFQTIEQAFTLPEGFEAFEAEVQVRSGKLRAPLEQSFAWKVGAQAAL